HAGRRPLFSGIERSLPPELADEDERLLRAFRQRYERLASASARLSLERLCEQVVAEHDYDLAVLARWDGARRYANLRKLARLARSYEELRGADVEGFVRFVREQESLGARELEAVAEEEGADAVRLLTIHAAKGLERGDARLLVRRDRYRPVPAADVAPITEDGQLTLFSELPTGPPPRGVELPPLIRVPPPPERVRRLSYSALALFERCSYRFYDE